MLRATLAVLCGLTLSGFSASAKDLTNRLGVGIKNNTSQSLPQVAVAYWTRPDFAITGGIGMDTQTDKSAFAAEAGVRRVLFREDNMNFYFGGHLAMVNYSIPNTSGTTDKQSGFEVNALFGGEFFLPGLESLGFTFEGGVGVVSLKDVRFRTVADDPFHAGIIFYF